MRRLYGIGAGLLVALSAWGQLQAPTVQPGQQLDAIAIRITRFGPWPASVTHNSAPFLLSVVNRSGIFEDTYSLILKPAAASSGNAATPASLLDLHSTETRQRDHQLIQLLPGDYELHFKSRPDWVVTITITAN